MQHREFAPPPQLSNAIKCFWHNTSHVSAFTVVPDGYTEIIFYFGGQCSVVQDGWVQEMPSPFLMGLLDKPAQFMAQGPLDIIGIRCYPWVVFNLLGLRADKQGVQVLEHPIAWLQAGLAEQMSNGKVETAIDMLSAFFLQLHSQIEPNPLMHKAGLALTSAGGTLPVSKVAEAAHATVRTLERQFKHNSGRTVKDVSGLMRFEQVRNHLWLHPDANLAGLAHELGYADQAHLSRAFKRYAGISPAAFARKAKQGGQPGT